MGIVPKQLLDIEIHHLNEKSGFDPGDERNAEQIDTVMKKHID